MITFFDPFCSENSNYLPDDESAHAIKSLRIRTGEHFNVVDGKGLILHCVAGQTKSNILFYDLISSEKKEIQGPKLHIAISPLKQTDRFEYFVEKATELGISEITPLMCKRSEKNKIKETRLHRILVSALKQSGNPYLPVINEAVKFEDFVKEVKTEIRLFGHCIEKEKNDLKSISFNSDTLFLVGPEGDFTEDEIALALKHKFVPVSLGQFTLRSETAGLTVCAYFQLMK